MEPIFKTKIFKIKEGKKIPFDDELVREIKLEIFVNSEKVGALMATPTDQKELAVGFLKAEGIIDRYKDIENIELLNDGRRVDIKAKANNKKIKRVGSEGVIVSGCGKGLSTQVEPEEIDAKIIRSDFKLSAKKLSGAMGEFYKECPLYEMTGCVHTAKLFVDDDTFFIGEDIAQHNTIDKAVGKAMMHGVDFSNSFLMVSGRLSSEMVAKAVMHQIPILASRTATTCLGYKIAETFSLTLIGFVRGERMNIYTGDERVEV